MCKNAQTPVDKFFMQTLLSMWAYILHFYFMSLKGLGAISWVI